jgi:hypothetical protein
MCTRALATLGGGGGGGGSGRHGAVLYKVHEQLKSPDILFDCMVTLSLQVSCLTTPCLTPSRIHPLDQSGAQVTDGLSIDQSGNKHVYGRSFARQRGWC